MQRSTTISASLGRFAYAVESLEQLIPSVQTALAEQLEPAEPIRHIIVAPRQNLLSMRRGWRHWFSASLPWEWTPDWVSVLTGQRLLVATITPKAAPSVTATPISSILSLELGTILLFSWFEWTWANQGHAERERIYFNTVSEKLFREMAVALRRDIATASGLPGPDGGRGLELLQELPFKFMNLIAHRLLLPDEQVQAVAYQPPIWTRHPWGFRTQRAAALTVLLSNYHLLIAQDDLSRGELSYGLIARYCPRDRIQQATLERGQDELWLSVTLGLGGVEETLRVLLERETEPELRELIGQMLHTPDLRVSSLQQHNSQPSGVFASRK